MIAVRGDRHLGLVEQLGRADGAVERVRKVPAQTFDIEAADALEEAEQRMIADAQWPGHGSPTLLTSRINRPHNGEGAPTPHLWIKYYDGTQTTADAYMVFNVGSADRPYGATRVGKGVCYFIAHTLLDENLWNGVPSFKAELSGIPLYDPSKDSTVGGSGTHRFGDRSTWGGDGDNFPAVQAYAVLRGISYAGKWVYGLQSTAAARLPAANWITQIGKCRVTVEGADGPEPSYRTGVQVNVSTQPVHLLESLMLGCQGKVSEIGGFYKLHLGAPDTPSFSFTDDDILSTESQNFRPFLALDERAQRLLGEAIPRRCRHRQEQS
ncbi:hypothetical protein ABIB95_003357 [Bradyrhizobium sp. LA2.1]